MSSPHSLIIGVTNSGKSTLAKKISQIFFSKGINVFIFDPYASSNWSSQSRDFKFSKPDNFIGKINQLKRGVLIIDEAPLLFDDYKNEMNGLMMRGRQQGLKIFLLAQRYKNLPPNSRGNANLVYAFSQSPEDTKLIKLDYPKCPDLASFQQGEYVALTTFDCSPLTKVF